MGLVRTLAYACAIGVFFPLSAPAQELTQGVRVRVGLDSPYLEKMEAVYRGVDGENLLLSGFPAGEVEAYPKRRVVTFEVYGGQKRQALKGLGLGAGIGAGVGIILGAASGDDEDSFIAFSAGDKALILGVTLGVAGGAAGLVAGALTKGDRWEPALIPDGRPVLRAGRGGGLEAGFELILR